MDTRYGVMKTECWPCEWYGGPIFNGQKVSNWTCYYWRTWNEAQSYCDKMNKRLDNDHRSEV